MVQYRYLLADLLTNQVTAELDLTNVSFTQQLNSAGSLSASLLLTGTPDPATALLATTPGRSAVYVDRNGVIVWGGVVWARSYNSNSQHVTINASEFESYFEHRRITANASFFNTDPLVIARSYITTAQSAPFGNIGIQVGNETSTLSVSSTVFGYEQRTVLAALQDLAKSGTGSSGTTGFDFSIVCAYDGTGGITKRFALGWPRLGISYSASSATVPVFEFPAGNVAEYEYPEDGSLVANTVYATGAGSNEGKLVYSSQDYNKFTAGWPLLETSTSYSNINDGTLIQNLAAGQLAAVSTPPIVLKLIVNPSTDPMFGSYSIGDDARVRIVDARFPNGLDTVYRIIGLTLTPGENGPERVTLTLSLPTS
jgi:hypothetical protein